MKEILLLKLGEMVLKGLNRRTFEEILLKNIRRRLRGLGEFTLTAAQSAIAVEPQGDADLDEAAARVAKIFGIVSFSRAAQTGKSMEEILRDVGPYLRAELEEARTFKVEAKRSDKRFPLNSPQISAAVGARLLEEFPHLRVDVHCPDVTVTVEVRDRHAFLRGGALPGAGGVPVGTGGRAAILISGGLDSPVAAWCMAKRGVELTAVHFASPPYTSERAEQKVKDLLAKVGEYAGWVRLFVLPFTHIQEEILEKCPEDLFTLVMRRFMMRAAERIARQEGCDALVTGESLGQVASQTMKAIACTDAVCGAPVFRPLIGMDKAEIVAISHRIGTYPISIEPYEDCCTVFTPRHPRTRPTLQLVEEAERALDVDALLEECLAGARAERIKGEF